MGGLCIVSLCVALLSAEKMPDHKLKARTANCVELYEKAVKAERDPLMITAIAHTESRFNKTAVSSAGARGILQVMPQWFCPKTGKCNYLQAGLVAWKKWRARYRGVKDSLCGYNSGRRCRNNKRGSAYANTVMRKYYRLKKLMQGKTCTP